MPTRLFQTQGPVDPAQHYAVPRDKEIAKLVERIKQGRYIVLFAPRQTGKTTFFEWALEALEAIEVGYFPIQLNFEAYQNLSKEAFYTYLHEEICEQILNRFQTRQLRPSKSLLQFLEHSSISDHVSMIGFLKNLGSHLKNQRLVIIIDEFDGIPTAAVSDFLHALRRIYLSKTPQKCPYSLGIIGVKNITQLNYDRSISPFNIQDDFALSNFTQSQVHALFEQYTSDTKQVIASDVIEKVYEQTAGQPFLVNRLGQILTEEMEIGLEQTLNLSHFEIAHQHILVERNNNISHLTSHIRQKPRFESVLMRIALKEQPVPFNLDNEIISELFTFGVIAPDSDGSCQIMNPIYQYRIMRTFQPLFNGLEDDYFPNENDFVDYLTLDQKINMRQLLANFHDFIARAGYRILQIPDTPQEFVGQYLLFGYLDAFVRQIQGFMYLEVRSGRGRMDLIILHQQSKYIVETKIWEGLKRYEAGKQQLAKYLKLEGMSEGYYVVFDHRAKPEARQEQERIAGLSIVSYTIPVLQERPSDQ
jgi:hypothetical protein